MTLKTLMRSEMEDCNYMTRPEIAKLLKISPQRVSTIAIQKNTDMPKHCAMKGTVYYYDRAEIKRWADIYKARNITDNRYQKEAERELDEKLVQQFIRGHFDRKQLQDRYKLKKMATKHIGRSITYNIN